MKSHYATISTEQPRYDLKVHLVWCPKYRKRVLTGQVATRVRDLLRQVAAENELRAGEEAVEDDSRFQIDPF